MNRRFAVIQLGLAGVLALVSFMALGDVEGINLPQTLRIFFSAFASGVLLATSVAALSRRAAPAP